MQLEKIDKVLEKLEWVEKRVDLMRGELSTLNTINRTIDLNVAHFRNDIKNKLSFHLGYVKGVKAFLEEINELLTQKAYVENLKFANDNDFIKYRFPQNFKVIASKIDEAFFSGGDSSTKALLQILKEIIGALDVTAEYLYMLVMEKYCVLPGSGNVKRSCDERNIMILNMLLSGETSSSAAAAAKVSNGYIRPFLLKFLRRVRKVYLCHQIQ